jgi:GNAT superfamily N-acetyltransferase
MTGMNPGVRPATKDDHEAAAETLALAFADDPAWARQMAAVFGARLPLATWTQLRLERRHPSSSEHWYFHYLGVEPRRQGHGLGGDLLGPVLELCDRQGIPSYLESSTERNRALYERNGFDLSGTFPMPAAGPTLRKMWRDPVSNSA